MDKDWKIEFEKGYGKFCDEFGKILIPVYIEDLLEKQRVKTIKHIVLETGKRYEVMTLNGKHVSYITLAVLENVLESI